jgi:flagellar biosynthesis chaperone FliJ
MSFQFSLAAVLSFRESLEQREYLALERIQSEIGRTEAQILEIGEKLGTMTQLRETELFRGIRSVHLQQAYEDELALERHLNLLQDRLRELKSRRQQQLKSYDLARQKRRVLDELRSHQLEIYTREQARRQQILLDDLFLARRKRGK